MKIEEWKTDEKDMDQETIVIYVRMIKKEPEKGWKLLLSELRKILTRDDFKLKPIKMEIHKVDEEKYGKDKLVEVLKTLSG